jgi:hypothetical protein
MEGGGGGSRPSVIMEKNLLKLGKICWKIAQKICENTEIDKIASET